LSLNSQLLISNFFQILFGKAPFWATSWPKWAIFLTKRLVTLDKIRFSLLVLNQHRRRVSPDKIREKHRNRFKLKGLFRRTRSCAMYTVWIQGKNIHLIRGEMGEQRVFIQLLLRGHNSLPTTYSYIRGRFSPLRTSPKGPMFAPKSHCPPLGGIFTP
jgi:hypothetical protein